MNPWRATGGDLWEWRLHATRCVLLAGAVAGWLLGGPGREPGAAWAGGCLALAIALDPLIHLGAAPASRAAEARPETTGRPRRAAPEAAPHRIPGGPGGSREDAAGPSPATGLPTGRGAAAERPGPGAAVLAGRPDAQREPGESRTPHGPGARAGGEPAPGRPRRPGPRPRGAGRRHHGLWLVAGLQVGLVLAAVALARAPALTGAVAAVGLGGPAATPRAWRPAWLGLPWLAGLVLLQRAGPAAGAAGSAVVLAGVVGGLWLVQWAEERRGLQQALEDLERAHARLVSQAARWREAAAERERQRLLGEIHDTVGHALTAGLLQVQVARRLLAQDPGAAGEHLARVEDTLRAALAETRRALRLAREPRCLPLAAALQRLADELSRAGGPRVVVELLPDATAVSDVAPRVATVARRAVQETLTNAVRHGGATMVHVRVEATGPELHLHIADNGRGTGQLVPGLGLQAMAHRVQAVGGCLRFVTAPGRGFRVELALPRHWPGREGPVTGAAGLGREEVARR